MSVLRWLSELEAEFREDDELGAEVLVDGFAAVLRRRLDLVLGVPAPPRFLEVGDRSVIELEGPPPGGGGDVP